MSLIGPSPPNKSTPLHLIIIGAGLCGLAAAISTALEGNRVSIFESASQLHEVGAGLQITPNGTRLLRKWKTDGDLAPKAAFPDTLSIRRFDGKLLARREGYQAETESKYGNPLWCLHRVDLQKALARRAEDLGVKLNFGCRINNIDFNNTTLLLENGTTVQGDVILATDGLWSAARNLHLDKPVNPIPTGDLAYRILLRADDIPDADLRQWITKPAMNIWIGPAMHIVAYSLHAGSMYNLVLLVPDDLPGNIAKGPGNVEEMRKLLEKWDPILNRFLAKVTKVDKWRLNHVPVLKDWESSQGTFALAGDSCHAMLPYLAQGANAALEDGAAFGYLLGKARTPDQIPSALAMYQKLRKPRVERIVNFTFEHRDDFHLEDGVEQERRDALFMDSFQKQQDDGKADWTHPKIQPWLYSYDIYAEAEKAYAAEPF